MKVKEKLRILLGVFLCLGMIIGLMQVNVSQVQADEGHQHCVCGGNDLSADGHQHNASQEWTGISDFGQIGSSGYYYLTDDITVNVGTFDSSSGYCYGWEFPNDVVLCLNGHNIIMDNPVDTTDEICVILVDHHFTLTDCHAGSQQGKITHASGKNGNGVKVVGGTFDMYGGIITGNTSKNDIGGAGVSVRGVNNAGTTTKFRMYGGEISGNKAKSGGGVYVTRGIYSNGPAEFYMYGGSIKNNIADSDTSTSCRGGGVYLGWTSKFIMSGGTISGNTAGQYGGGVYAAALAKEYVSSSSGSATIEISNKATVTGNSAAGESNNICLDSDKTSIDAISAKITITDVFTGTIGISTTTPPTSGNPVAIDAV